MLVLSNITFCDLCSHLLPLTDAGRPPSFYMHEPAPRTLTSRFSPRKPAPVFFNMDRVWLAASAIGITQLTGGVVKKYGGQLQEVNDARTDIITLRRSVSSIQMTVQKLKELLQGLHGPKLPTSPLLLDNITHCLPNLEALEKRIDPGKRKDMMRILETQVFKWPLKREEVDTITKGLERYKSSLNLSLHVDQV